MVSFRSVFEHVLDAIVPPRARSARTRARAPADIPLCPTIHSLLGQKITTIMDYREQAVQDLIRALKYDGSSHAAALAAALLADYLREEIASMHLFSTQATLLAALPLHKSRLRERGFNQIKLVLQALPREFKDGTLCRQVQALSRVRATPSQTKLSRTDRIQNVRGAFYAVDAHALAGTTIFLIDDITTTGASLVSAGQALRAAGADVNLMALARA